MANPKVSIIVITYNHQEYIRDAFESFLQQKTTFPFEVIIGDDSSTDNTQKIITEYAKKYPFIKPVLRKKNIGPMPNFVDTLRRSTGEYVALCEGDDYWADPMKLQKQVDFLDSHKDYALCFHPVRVVFEGKELADSIFPDESSGFDLKRLLHHNFIQTNSVVYRRQNYDHIPTDILPGDWYAHLYHAQFGKIGFIDTVMSVYRRHQGGLWWDQHNKPQLIWEKYGLNYLKLLHEIMLLYGSNKSYKKIIDNHISGSFEAIAAIEPERAASRIASEAIKVMPSETWDYIQHLISQVSHYSKHDAYLQGVLDSEAVQKQQYIQNSEQSIKQLNDELEAIKTSKAWKIVNTIRHNKQQVRQIGSYFNAATNDKKRTKK